MAEIKKVAQAKKNLDGLQFAYNMAAQQLGGLIKSGADPNSPEVQQARAARDASWQALMKAYGTYMGDGQQKPKKSKNKAQSQPQNAGAGAGAGGDQGNLIAELASPDPVVKRDAYYKLAIKLGPPDEWQNKQWLSPDAVKARELARQQQATQGTVNQVQQQAALHQQKVGDIQAQIDQLATKQNRTPDEDAKLKQLEATKKVLTGPDEAVQSRRALIDAGVEDVTKMNGGKPPTPEQYERILEAAGALHVAPSEGDVQWFYDEKTGQLVGGMNKKTGEYVKPPQELAGKGVTSKAPGGAGQGANAHPTVEKQYNADKSFAGTLYTWPDGRTAYVPAPGQSAAPPKQSYGSGGSAEEVDILKKSKDLRLAANEAKKFIANPTGPNAQALIYAYVKANVAGAGRLTQTEILMAARAGSYGTQIKNWADKAMTGHPDKEFMKEMADTIETAAKEAEKLAEQGRGNQAPPPPAGGSGDQATPTDAKDFIRKHGG